MPKCFHCHRTAMPGHNLCQAHMKSAQQAASPGAATREGTEPVAWRTRYRSEPGMIGHYPWTYTERIRGMRLDQYEYEPLFATPPVPTTEPTAKPIAAQADCDQAFEEHYKCSARDPSNAGDLAIWRAAWGAKKVREIAEPCSDHGCAVLGASRIEPLEKIAMNLSLQDRIDALNSSLECEKRMRKDSDERMENAEAALKAARVQALEEAAKVADDKAKRVNSAWIARDIADAIRRMGEGKP